MKYSITAEKLSDGRGGYVQINNLLVEVKFADDNSGYIIDLFNNDTEVLLDSVTIWSEELEEDWEG